MVDSYHSHDSTLGFSSVYTLVNVVILVMVLLNIVVYKARLLLEANSSENWNNSALLHASCRRFKLDEILAATSDFDDSLVIGEGGFGKVYRGVIDNGGSIVGIKRLNKISAQGVAEFRAEIEMLTRIRHCNIISLLGFCDSSDAMILVYEYMACGTLANCCHSSSFYSVPWVSRLKMCICVARGLNYLHTGTLSNHVVIHRDVKGSNIMLNENYIAKISDFGLSKIARKEAYSRLDITEKYGFTDGVCTNVWGTFGYADPEYMRTGILTSKADVYAFGVVIFEVLSGRHANDHYLDEKQSSLIHWVKNCIKKGNVDQIIKPDLRPQILLSSSSTFIQIANKCVKSNPSKRPTMAEVVVQLRLALDLQEGGCSSVKDAAIFPTCQPCPRNEPQESSRSQDFTNNIIWSRNFVQPDKRISNRKHVLSFLLPLCQYQVFSSEKARVS